MHRSSLVLLGLPGICLTLWTAWSYAQSSESVDVSERRFASLDKLGEEISLLRQQAKHSTTVAGVDFSPLSVVESASQEAGLDPQVVFSVRRGSSNRIGDTEFLQNQVLVGMRPVTMTEFATFATKLAQSGIPLRIEHVALAAPREVPDEQHASERWEVRDLILTYLSPLPKSEL